MKTLQATVLLLLLSVCGQAQTMEFGQLTITPYISEESGFDAEASTLLQDKLAHAVALANASGGFDKHFVITPKVDIYNATTTATIPQKVSLKASVTFFVGDGIDGTLFTSCHKDMAGVGDSRRGAILSAIRKIDPADKELQGMIAEGRERIEQYYKAMAPKIIAEARTLISSGHYDEAMAQLAIIPRSCGDYDKAQSLMSDCAQKQIDNNNMQLIVKARAAWSANPDKDGATEAAAYLNDIETPSAKITAEVNKLTGEMRSRLSEVENKQLQITQLQIASDERIRKEELKAQERLAEGIIKAATPQYRVIRWF